jgi:hypothetical protein
MASLYVFPKEILEHIFLLCDLKTVGTCIRVCKKLLNVTQNQSFWLGIFSRFGNLREVMKQGGLQNETSCCDGNENRYEDWCTVRTLIQRFLLTKNISPVRDFQQRLDKNNSTIPKRVFKGPLYIENFGKTLDAYRHLFLFQSLFINLHQLIGDGSFEILLNDDDCSFYDKKHGIIKDATYCRQNVAIKGNYQTCQEMYTCSLYSIDSIVTCSLKTTIKVRRLRITMDLQGWLDCWGKN